MNNIILTPIDQRFTNLTVKLDCIFAQNLRDDNSFKAEVSTSLPLLEHTKKLAFLCFLDCLSTGMSADQARIVSNEILIRAGLAPVPADFGRSAE